MINAMMISGRGGIEGAWILRNFSTGQEETSTANVDPSGLYFSTDGTKMYTSDQQDYIYQYDLSTPWDIITSSYNSVNVSTQDSTAQGLTFSADGSKMYEIGQNQDKIYQYDLSTDWDLSTADYATNSVNINTQDATPRGVFFKPDGSRMYETGTGGDKVYQYDLGTNWDLSTADYATDSVNIVCATTDPQDLFFKPDGSRMWTVHTNDLIYQYDLGTNWDVSTADYATNSVNIDGITDNITGLFFSPDGFILYTVDTTNEMVYQIYLKTPWDIEYFYPGMEMDPEGTNVQGLWFKPDGTRMYSTDMDDDNIYQYDLSTAWDITSAVYNSVTISTAAGGHQNIVFSTDGSKMYSIDKGDYIYQYDLSTNWDLSTADYATNSVKLSTESSEPNGLFFKPDGSRMYISDTLSDLIYQYDLSTDWDLSTADYATNSVNKATQGTFTQQIFFKPDGLIMYEADSASDMMHQWTLSTPWDLSTASIDTESAVPVDNAIQSLFFKPDGSVMYQSDNLNNKIYQLKIRGKE